MRYKFSECITACPPNEQSNYLVIYKVEELDSSLGSPQNVNGYFEAADRLVNVLYTEGLHPGSDNLAMPLLNLYVNGIEFLLKLLIKELDAHRRKKCCTKILDLGKSFENSLRVHNLKKLIEITKKIIPDSNLFHSFPEFHEFCDFIEEFSDYGVDSVSTRYFDVSREVLFHKKQVWINFRKIQENCKYINKVVMDYIYVSLPHC